MQQNRCLVRLVYLIGFLVPALISFAGDRKSDGPYVLYTDSSQLRVIAVDKKGVLIDSIVTPSNGYSFPVTSSDGQFLFDVQLHPIVRQEWKLKQPKRIAVLSDPHGDWESFVSVLKANSVVDEQYRWTYGDNYLIIIGDVFDRGTDVLPIFWLIYRLEREADAAGGKVLFLLGNHEEMVLRNNLKYADEKYLDLAVELGVPYHSLWSEYSELGRWLRTRNTIQLIGRNLFVHAGLSADLISNNATIATINQTISQGLSLKKELREQQAGSAGFLFGNAGPLWYRGMVLQDEKYKPVKSHEIDALLKKYKATRIVVGHTIFDDITIVQQGRVIAVNVHNAKNRAKGKGRGLLIQKNNLFVLFDAAISVKP